MPTSCPHLEPKSIGRAVGHPLFGESGRGKVHRPALWQAEGGERAAGAVSGAGAKAVAWCRARAARASLSEPIVLASFNAVGKLLFNLVPLEDTMTLASSPPNFRA